MSAGIAAVLVAGVGAQSALAVAPPPDSTFTGQSAQAKADNRHVELKTDSDGQVSRFEIGWRAKCRSGSHAFDVTTLTGSMRRVRDIFRGDGSYTSKLSRNVKGRVEVSVRGTFPDTDNAEGTWKVRVTIFRKGKKIDKCKANTSWSAARVE